MGGGRGGDDAALWARLAESVTPLRRRRPASIPAPAPASVSEPATTAPAKKLRGRVPRTPAPKPAPPPPVPDLVPGRAPGLDRRNALRLRRGLLPIEARLDLHGMTREQAAAALDRFVRAARRHGRRCVLVITGKGTRGPGGEGGAIRRELPLWLNGAALRPFVVAFAEAQPKDGGAGAYYVYLRRARDR